MEKIKHNRFSKVLVLLMAVMMVLTMMPNGMGGAAETAWAAEDEATEVTVFLNAVLTIDDDAEIICGEKLTVADGLAEAYGYSVPREDHNGVEIKGPVYLDALVAAHIKKYGDAFTKETAQNYLKITNAGFIEKAFNQSFSYGVVLVNGKSASDGIKLAGSATGYLVTTARIFENDILTAMNGPAMGQEYNTFYDRTELNLVKDEEVTLTLKGNQPVMEMWQMPGAGDIIPISAEGGAFTVTCGYYALDSSTPNQLVYFNDGNTTPDSNGAFTFKFTESGKYLVTSEVYDNNGNQCVQPFCYVTVENTGTLSDIAQAQNTVGAITWENIRGENASDCIMNVTKNLLLTDSVSWTSSNPQVISDTGVVFPTKVNGMSELITLTATATVNDATAQKRFTLMVRKPSAAQKFEVSSMADGISGYYARNTAKIDDWWSTIAMQQYLKLNPETGNYIYAKQKQALVDSAIEMITNTAVGNAAAGDESTAIGKLSGSILMLEALGYEAEDIISLNKTKINAVEKLAKADFAKAETYEYYASAAPYAILALRTSGNKYDKKISQTVDYLVNICEGRGTDWGYTWGETYYADYDTPAMIMHGLAPYYTQNTSVKEAIDNLVEMFSEHQDELTGGLGNTATNAVVAIALSGIGIDLSIDGRFITKSEKSMIDAFSNAYQQTNYNYNFGDDFSNKQGLLALVTMQNVMNSQTAYDPFDFSAIKKEQAVATSKGNPTTPSTPTGDDITVKMSIQSDTGEFWMQNQSVIVPGDGATVYHAFTKACDAAGITYVGAENGYVRSMTKAGKTLAEFTNGKNSGWLYKVNNILPDVGLTNYSIKDGDSILWYYTNDWTKDPDAGKHFTSTETKSDVTTSGASGSAITTAPTDVKVSEKTNADGTKETVAAVKVDSKHHDEIIKQAAENKSAEIVLEVSQTDSKGADNVQLTLDVAFVKNVADKTNADLTVNTENGKVTLDREALKTVLGAAKGTTLTLEVSKVAKPTEAQKKAAGANAYLFKLIVKSGGKSISDFNKGSAQVRLALPSALLDKKTAAIHIAEDGTIEQFAGKVLTISGKKYYEFTTPHFSTFALVDAEEAGLDVVDEQTVDAKALAAKLTPAARSAKTTKKNVRVKLSLDKQDKEILNQLADAGYTVRYRFYRSTKKAAGYKAAVTKKTMTYTNTTGKQGTKYFYKVQIRVYDKNGKLAAKTALKQCRYACRNWTK